ncbi:xylitol dehydrogenase [Moelleriella libera RCEF 2490]|uniref:L-arabinitol 4-dehydrogenase n=1 Tax=Moelleriella libera RCEF 2490 TaxID=1081109 RepID=A0A167X7R1_9HYPO|nr:xylitol dehydrogenase [Moelleriella libera RCEF 2490]
MATQTMTRDQISPWQNLSFVLNKPYQVTFEDRPKPTLESPHHAIVAINYTGICGSDVHYWHHGAIGHFVVKDPMVLGHESAGTVVEVGAAVTHLRPGDRVAIEPGYACRRCSDCRAGRYNLCDKMVFAATPPYDGTLTGLWASPGQSVVVMGAGPVGLLCAAVARRAYGASTVASVDIVQSKLDFALAFASTHAYLSQRVSPEANAQAIKEHVGLLARGGADVVIDASGAEPSIQTSLHTVRMGGTYVQGGMGKSDITFPIMAMCLKEVTAKGSFRYGPGDYELAVDLVASGKVDIKKLVSDVVPFEKAEEAFRKVKEGEVIKILIAGPNEKL